MTTPNFTLALLVMVVIGGAGSRWGAMIGGLVYTYLDHRLADLAGSHAISTLPSVLRTPLQEPLFILGLLFILVVYFAPGGLARLGRIRRRPRALEEASVTEDRVGVAGRRRAVLLMHGLGYTRQGWGPLRELLAHRYRVLVFDNRGIGESESRRARTRRELARDALQVLDEAGVERAHVVGASLGGFVAQPLAADHARARRPARARVHDARRRRRLPAAAADARAHGRGAVARARGRAAALRRERARARRALGARRRDLRLPAGAPARSGRLGRAGRGRRRLGRGDRLARIAAPTLVVAGTDDAVVDPRNAQLLADAIPARGSS